MTDWEKEISRVLIQFRIIKSPVQSDAADNLETALQDYDSIAGQHRKMMRHFFLSEKPLLIDGRWICPECGSRVGRNHIYCHHCGKRLSWEAKNKKRGKENGKEDTCNDSACR